MELASHDTALTGPVDLPCWQDLGWQDITLTGSEMNLSSTNLLSKNRSTIPKERFITGLPLTTSVVSRVARKSNKSTLCHGAILELVLAYLLR